MYWYEEGMRPWRMARAFLSRRSRSLIRRRRQLAPESAECSRRQLRQLDRNKVGLQKNAADWPGPAESDQISGTLRERVLNGTSPPDEAYWWTRIAFLDAVARLTDACA